LHRRHELSNIRELPGLFEISIVALSGLGNGKAVTSAVKQDIRYVTAAAFAGACRSVGSA